MVKSFKHSRKIPSYRRLRRYAPESVTRSLPFIKFMISNIGDVNRMQLLRGFPTWVADDIIEILYNIVMGNIHAPKNKINQLRPHVGRLKTLVNQPNKTMRREYVYKQSGGFISALLPIAASIIGGLIGNAIRKDKS